MNLIEYLKQQTAIPESKADKFITLLEKYDENDVLYETAINDIDLTNEEYEELFEELERENYVDSIFIIKCPFCDTLGNTYVEKFDIPEFDECRFCHNEFNHRENYETAYRIYFNYQKKIDVLTDLSEKINYNQERIFEISDEIRELEDKRKAIQSENIKFATLRNELLVDKSESKMYNKVAEKYRNQKVKYIGTLLYMKKCVITCLKCDEAYELFQIDNQYIGVCSKCHNEIGLNFNKM
ncbi:MAG: hypothetical protein K0R80_1693 [Clostridia bacterium]|jgi:hypothetical protein|nr:hypothetical protein [Clostridia bacterium]MDF2891326.1 hypothetical protein [Clostridia bacterium]